MTKSSSAVSRPRYAALTALAAFGFSLGANAQPLPAPGQQAPAAQAPAAQAPAAQAPAAQAPPQAPAGQAPAPVLPAEAPRAAPAPAPDVPPAAAEPAAPAEPAAAPIAETTALSAADAAEAAALEAELTANAISENVSTGPRLSIYGFADFTFSKQLNAPLMAEYESFAVGNINLYLNAELGDSWRSLTEVRFTYLPHGTTPFNPSNPELSGGRIDTSVSDYTDHNRPMRTGSIEIERAWLEYGPHHLINVRVGQWLTPYGIWNVDHGSPVIIGARRPYIIGESFFPERQTGIEAYGAFYVDATKLGYHLTLSNGRGPIDSYQDLDHNKAVGARVYVQNDSVLGSFTVGAAGYRGKYTDRKNEFLLDEESGTATRLVSQYDELSLSVDVKWEWQDLLVQGEAIVNDVAFNDKVRPLDIALTGGPIGWTPDNRRYGLYTLIAYRTPLANLMPFVGGELYELGPHTLFPTALAFWGGLNMRPTPSVVLKAQYTNHWFTGDVHPVFEDEAISVLDFQAAWSF